MNLAGIRFSDDKHQLEPTQLNDLLRKVGWSSEDWGRILGQEDCEIVTAWEGAECAGMGTLLALWPTANLGTVCVDPAFQGLGIATEISSRLLHLAEEKGCLEVTSDTGDDRMRKILSKLGFGETGRSDGKTFYRKSLSSITER